MFFVQVHKPKFGLFLHESISIFLSCSLLSLFLFFFQFLAHLSSFFFFAWNCDWLIFKERDKFNLQRVVCK